ncbi:TetR/AcrR family transcriptional regulator [Cellulomonas endophytica]|uniref:TetR/AcrR family transcriptional regulator n=1 Tax=Cellulomonas endophytica TaxID=2494735 RepID=UPI00101082F8|nr:TetR/AcrR family transcriptional regulator [Cellulomonas endophytica]
MSSAGPVETVRRRRVTADGYAKGRARRRQIIAAAAELYGEVGYRSASLREVAARAGLSHPGLLHHFGTKEALLLAVLEQRDEEDTAAFVEGRRGVAALAGIVDIVERNTRRPAIVELFCVLSAEATAVDHPAHAWFRQRYGTVLAAAATAYREAAEDGRLRAEVDPEDAARRLVALMDGLQVQFLYDRDGTDMVARLRAELQSELTVPLA